jgi:N-acetyl-gamma-glutamylphosphate reductase
LTSAVTITMSTVGVRLGRRVWPAQIKDSNRVANPGCFPAAALSALAPLLVDKLIEPGQIVIDAKTGVSGTPQPFASRALVNRLRRPCGPIA